VRFLVSEVPLYRYGNGLKRVKHPYGVAGRRHSKKKDLGALRRAVGNTVGITAPSSVRYPFTM